MEYSAGIIPFRRNSKGEVEFFVGHQVALVGNGEIIGHILKVVLREMKPLKKPH